eukprot:EG_transcript_7214
MDPNDYSGHKQRFPGPHAGTFGARPAAQWQTPGSTAGAWYDPAPPAGPSQPAAWSGGGTYGGYGDGAWGHHPWPGQHEFELPAEALRRLQERQRQLDYALADVVDAEEDVRRRVAREEDVMFQLVLESEVEGRPAACLAAVASEFGRTRATLVYQWELELEDLRQAQRSELKDLIFMIEHRELYRLTTILLEEEKIARRVLREEETGVRSDVTERYRGVSVALRLKGLPQQEATARLELLGEVAAWQRSELGRFEATARHLIVGQQLFVWAVQFQQVAAGWKLSHGLLRLQGDEERTRSLIAEEQAATFDIVAKSEPPLRVEAMHATQRQAWRRINNVLEDEMELRQRTAEEESAAWAQLTKRYHTDLGVWLRWVAVKQEKQRRAEALREEALAWHRLWATMAAEQRGVEEVAEARGRAALEREETSLRAETWAAFFTTAHQLARRLREGSALRIQRVWRGVLGRQRVRKRRHMVGAAKTWQTQMTKQFTTQHRSLLEDERAARQGLAERQEQDRRAYLARFRQLGGDLIGVQLTALLLQEDA